MRLWWRAVCTCSWPLVNLCICINDAGGCLKASLLFPSYLRLCSVLSSFNMSQKRQSNWSADRQKCVFYYKYWMKTFLLDHIFSSNMGVNKETGFSAYFTDSVFKNTSISEHRSVLYRIKTHFPENIIFSEIKEFQWFSFVYWW